MAQSCGRPNRKVSEMASMIIGKGMVSPCLKKSDDGLQFPKGLYHQQTLGHIHGTQSRGSVVLKTYPLYHPCGHRVWFLMDRMLMFLPACSQVHELSPRPTLICPLPDCPSLRIDCISQHLWFQHLKFIKKICSLRKTL